MTSYAPSLSELRDAAAQELARRNFLDFCYAVYPHFEGRRHHVAIAEALEALERGDISRLIFEMPPRHGKSTLASHLFPPWYLGRNPDHRVIACSYSVDLSFDLSRKARNIIASPGYSDIFPDVHLAADARAVGQWDLEKPNLGGYVSAGVGGGITGKGANCLPAGTMVATSAGPVAIENLEPCPSSVKIVCYDEHAGRVEYKSQEAFSKREAPGLYRITTAAGRVVEATAEHPFWTRRGYVEAAQLAPGDALLCLVRGGVRAAGVRDAEAPGAALHGSLLLPRVLTSPSCDQAPPALRRLPQPGREENPQVLRGMPAAACAPKNRSPGTGCDLPDVQSTVPGEVARQDGERLRDVLLEEVRRAGPLTVDGRQGQSQVEARGNAPATAATLREGLSGDAATYPRARRTGLRGLPFGEIAPRSPHRQLADEQRRVQSRDALRKVPSGDSPRTRLETAADTVALVERIHTPATVYDLQVAGNRNFFANGVLVHNCLIIDDPVKNAEEAGSATTLEGHRDWYTSTAYTRLEGTGAVILIVTRWAEDDLAGWLQAQQAHGGDQWHVVHLPALAEEGDALGREVDEALWPEKYDTPALEHIRSVVGARDFAALYQQRPSPAGGAVFKREWWKRYSSFDRSQAQQIIQVWDTAFKTKETNDYSVCATWALTASGAYLLDIFRDRLEFPELKRKAKDLFAAWRPVAVLIEDKASGQSLVQELQRDTLLPVLPVPRGTDKLVNAHAVTPYIEAGRVFVPESAPWVDAFLEEHAAFDRGKHDDQVDTTSMALKRLFGDIKAFSPDDIAAALSDAAPPSWLFTEAS